jgi:hypothetical protein
MKILALTVVCAESLRAPGDHVPIVWGFPSGDRYWKTRVSGTACSQGASGAAVDAASASPLAG